LWRKQKKEEQEEEELLGSGEIRKENGMIDIELKPASLIVFTNVNAPL